MVKEDTWLTLDEVKTRLIRAGYEVEVENQTISYNNNPSRPGKRGMIMYNVIGKGYDDQALRRVEA